MPNTTHRFILLALLVAGGACKGTVNEQPAPGTGTGTGGGSGGAGGEGVSAPAPAAALTVHRLNRVEYNNTVRDLLGTTLTPADDFIEDELGSKPGASFDNLADNLGANPSVARISQ